MKKHPVDDLFARKLSEWEAPVSSEAWEKIAAGSKKKVQRPAHWYWYAAAGIILAILTGYGVWQSQLPLHTSQGTLAGISTGKQPSNPDKASLDTTVMPNLKSGEGTAPSLAQRVLRPEPDYARDQDPTDKSATLPVARPLVTQPPISQGIAALPRETHPVLPDEDNSAIATLPTIELPTAAQETIQDKPQGDRILIAHVEIEPATSDEQKSSRLIRVLRQLKNAKEGEAVDWEEVGLNPKKLVARADERLKNEEEKVSKYYQTLKDKTKL